MWHGILLAWYYVMMLLCQNESSLEKKTISLKNFFQTSQNPVSWQDEDGDTKFSYQVLPWISCKVTWRLRNVNIGGSLSLTDIVKPIVAICKIMSGIILRWKKIMNGKNLLLRVMRLF